MRTKRGPVSTLDRAAVAADRDGNEDEQDAGRSSRVPTSNRSAKLDKGVGVHARSVLPSDGPRLSFVSAVAPRILTRSVAG